MMYRMRFNDGVVDHEGRYWASTMNDPKVKAPPTDEGVLFRLDPDMKLHRMIEKVSIPNGICFSPDEKLMYFIDSPTGNGKGIFRMHLRFLRIILCIALCRSELSKPPPGLLPGQFSLLYFLSVIGNADSKLCQYGNSTTTERQVISPIARCSTMLKGTLCLMVWLLI